MANTFSFINTNRKNERQKTGVTMILDKGYGINAATDFANVAGKYADFVKLGWGTSALYDFDIVAKKVEIYKEAGIQTYVGGTLLERIILENGVDEYFEEIKKLGIETVEISDGSTEVSLEVRNGLIKRSKDLGYLVITEVGKKNPDLDAAITTEQRINLIKNDIDNGANFVLIESREAGKNIGVYDANGNIKQGEVDALSVYNERLIWEAPNKSQQIEFIEQFGVNINLGNIAPEELIPLETLRTGLRGDTVGKISL